MIVPLEVLEQILLKCDGKTLLAAEKSCEKIRLVIEYLEQKTRLWEWCCTEEIPPEQLVEYLLLYKQDGTKKWKHIYMNWNAWDTHSSCMLEPKLCPNNAKIISCIAVSSHHIAVGSEDGRLILFTQHWQPVFEHRIVATKLTSLTFVGWNDYNDIKHLDLCLVVRFHKGLSILSFDGVRRDQYDILDVKSHSIYENHICIEKVGGRMTILEIRNAIAGRDIKEIWFTRIYSPRCITTYKMWNGKCTFLINNYIWTLDYKRPDITPMDEMKKVLDVRFYAPLMLDNKTTRIYRDNIIINLYKNADKSSRCPDVIEDYIEIIIIKPNSQYSKKMFNVWEILKCKITCIFLYGNCLLIGTDCGTVYFYLVNNWKNFNLNRPCTKQIVGKHSIIDIAVKETETERKYYVCSKFAIHEINTWIPS